MFGPCCQVDGLVSGFPCTSASALNMCAQGFKDTSSATGGGFKAVKGYIKKFQPQFAVLENVKTLCHSRKVDGGMKPIDFIMAEMTKLGYVTAYDVVNTMTFGLPQSRPGAGCFSSGLMLSGILFLIRSSPCSQPSGPSRCSTAT